MVQWQCDLNLSWRTRLFSLFAYAALVLLTLVILWPEYYGVLCLVFVVFDFVRSQKNIISRQGEIKLQRGNFLIWENQKWLIVKQPWVVQNGVLFSLRRLKDSYCQGSVQKFVSYLKL